MDNTMIDFLTANTLLLHIAIEESDAHQDFIIADSDPQHILPTFHSLREISTTTRHLMKYMHSVQPKLTKIVLYDEDTEDTLAPFAICKDVLFATLMEAAHLLNTSDVFPLLQTLIFYRLSDHDLLHQFVFASDKKRFNEIFDTLRPKDIKLVTNDGNDIREWVKNQ